MPLLPPVGPVFTGHLTVCESPGVKSAQGVDGMPSTTRARASGAPVVSDPEARDKHEDVRDDTTQQAEQDHDLRACQDLSWFLRAVVLPERAELVPRLAPKSIRRPARNVVGEDAAKHICHDHEVDCHCVVQRGRMRRAQEGHLKISCRERARHLTHRRGAGSVGTHKWRAALEEDGAAQIDEGRGEEDPLGAHLSQRHAR